MSFEIFIGIAIVACIAGIVFRLVSWFGQSITPSKEKIPLSDRLHSAVTNTIKAIFSIKLVRILQSIFVDLLLQKRIFDKSMLRWIMHGLIFFGFIGLLVSHALGDFFFSLFGSEYVPTLMPSLMLRNIFGAMAFIGICIAVYRRISLRSKRLRNYPSDWLALTLVGLIMVSGFLLEGSKMSSYSVYQNMVEDYGFYDGEEAEALEAYWVAEYGLNSPNINRPVSQDMVEMGRELNQEGSCIECHAANSNAFISYSFTSFLGAIGNAIGDTALVTLFLVLHLGSCLFLLAWLPFSKMFHIISAPVSLITNRVASPEDTVDPVASLNRHMVGLSACTHCGSCTVECSSLMFYESFQNDFILPSEKVQYLKKIAANKPVDSTTLERLQKGLYICTSCDRCTNICPSGINLKDIFVSARYVLLEQGKPETSMLSHFSFPLALAQNFAGDHLKALKAVHDLFKSKFSSLPAFPGPITLNKAKGFDNNSYKGCFSCQRCTNICPVVRGYDDPAEALDMMPHQIIFSLGIGNIDMALGSNMIWSCSTCYLCQEHCPNQVELTDIFYRLKNMAINKIEAGDN